MRKYFGTDGVRGIANTELSPELCYQLARAAGQVLGDETSRKVLIGRDTRISGDMVFASLVAGLTSSGYDVLDLGITPTPAVAHLVREYEASFGIVISASHNPYEFNGIKFFSSKGLKLPDEVEFEIEDLIDNPGKSNNYPSHQDIGRVIDEDRAHRTYIDFLKSKVDLDLTGMKIVLDCASGATTTVAPELFKELGGEIIVLNQDYDGININQDSGSTNPELIQKAIRENDADIGLAFDGDGDRLIAVDEKGEIVDGDHFLAILASHMKKEGKLRNNTVVGTVMANIGLDRFLKEEGIDFIKTAVGDRYVLDSMLENDYPIGGEQSGHFIFIDDNTTGDGILSGLKLLEVMKSTGKKLSELNSLMTSYPQVLKNANVPNDKKHSYQEDSVIVEEISKTESLFDGNGRVLIRPSGTEPLVRVMIEGEDSELLEKEADRLVEVIESRLN